MPPRNNGNRASSRLRSVPPDETKETSKPKSTSRKRAASVAVDADSEVDKAQPKKRSRGDKTHSATKLEPVNENVPEEKEEEEPTPPSPPPAPRKRGRPPGKVAPPSTTTATGGQVKDKREKAVLARGSRTKAINTVPEPASHPRPPRLAFVFGSGDFGQFGLGTETLGEIARPRLHAWFETAAKNNTLGSEGAGLETICAGGMHSLAIDEAGKVWSWGINDNAALGRPTVDVPDPENPSEILEAEILETQPMVAQSLADENFRAVAVSAGDSVSVALGLDGDLRSWGSFRSSEGLLGFDGKLNSSKTQLKPLPIPSLTPFQFVQVACGTDHVLALTTGGHVYTWGAGQTAQLGRRIIERRKANGLSPERLSLRNIVLIGCGSYHSFAVNSKGVVYAWGLNSLKQTGVSPERGGDDDIIWHPTEVDALHPSKLNGRKVTQISGGEHHTLFLLNDGSVMGCGRCDGREVGLADDHPLMIDIATRRQAAKDEAIKKVQEAERKVAAKAAAGEEAMDTDEIPSAHAVIDEFISEPTLIAFPPPPTTSDPNPSLPPHSASSIDAPTGNPMAFLSAGTRHNLAVSRAGHAYSWGSGSGCQLGLGSDVEVQPVPTRVRSKALEGWNVQSAAAGGQHCFLLATKVA
ncbi:hypothetical protein Clacol_000429 [Clathrus columnatus]|uniref:RCC1-like domain-containing protein n=1 Tax=Clathrus columnatus TaxID=1419009 RepID=A0AAV4ZWK6_9AGAM|nr:hypothetical protein Clacol_000429 [Clathrus columnatus]